MSGYSGLRFRNSKWGNGDWWILSFQNCNRSLSPIDRPNFPNHRRLTTEERRRGYLAMPTKRKRPEKDVDNGG
ncbi:hypothetical protein YC2023_089922 [Brassica napus]